MSHARTALYDHYDDSPRQLISYAQEYFSHVYPTGHPADHQLDHFRWIYHSAFPILALAEHHADLEYWEQWCATERIHWKSKYPESEYDDMEVWWTNNPHLYPVIMVRGSDDKWYLGDGAHRIAIAYKSRMWHVPAVVGI